MSISGLERGFLATPFPHEIDPEWREHQSLDPNAGQTYRGKPIWSVPRIAENLNRTGWDWYTNNYGELDDGVLSFGFWTYAELAQSYYVTPAGDLQFTEADSGIFTAFNDDQKAIARRSIALWDDLVDIRFEETDVDEADITYGNTYTGGAQAYAYLPFGDIFDDTYELVGFDQVGRLSGDVWIDGYVSSNFFPVVDSYYAVTTIIHETGHALGLSHPGDYDALDDDDGDGVPDPISYGDDAFYAQDSLQYSIMSYWDAFETGAQPVDWSLTNFAYPATPLVHDIAAIQRLYGADLTTRTGDTVYGFNSTAGRSAYDFDINTRPIVSIWDAGGNDTLDFSGWSTPSVIDLNAGAFSSGGGILDFLTLEQVNANRAALGLPPRSAATWQFYEDLKEQLGLTDGLFKDNISIAYGATIENAVGGAGHDLLVASPVGNRLAGGWGYDEVSYATATSGVVANLTTGTTSGGSGADTLVAIEKLLGSDFADHLTGNWRKNVLSGGAGDDRLDGLADDDALRGGPGSDSLYAGTGNDRLHGGPGPDRLYGQEGNDLVDGGPGADIVSGGSGADLFRFAIADGKRDVIGDFARGLDKVDLRDLDAIAGTAQRDPFDFIGDDPFTAAGQLRGAVLQGSYTLLGNVDNDAAAELVIALTAINAPLQATDILFA